MGVSLLCAPPGRLFYCAHHGRLSTYSCLSRNYEMLIERIFSFFFSSSSFGISTLRIPSL